MLCLPSAPSIPPPPSPPHPPPHSDAILSISYFCYIQYCCIHQCSINSLCKCYVLIFSSFIFVRLFKGYVTKNKAACLSLKEKFKGLLSRDFWAAVLRICRAICPGFYFLEPNLSKHVSFRSDT